MGFFVSFALFLNFTRRSEVLAWLHFPPYAPSQDRTKLAKQTDECLAITMGFKARMTVIGRITDTLLMPYILRILLVRYR